jgi:hypothetical protein
VVELVTVGLAIASVVKPGLEGDELTTEDDAPTPENSELVAESREILPVGICETVLLKDTDPAIPVDETAVDIAEKIDPESVTSDAEATLAPDGISEDDIGVLRDKVDDRLSQSP